MYTLTLTKDERLAFEWIGDRYAAGEVMRTLVQCLTGDDSWEQDGDMTFTVPEPYAWAIKHLAEDEDGLWPCFSPELTRKMNDFIERIV